VVGYAQVSLGVGIGMTSGSLLRLTTTTGLSNNIALTAIVKSLGIRRSQAASNSAAPWLAAVDKHMVGMRLFSWEYTSTHVILYYLAIKNIPGSFGIFARFYPFALLATLVGAPVSAFLGRLQIEASPMWTSEQDMSVEANPYNCRLPPGYFKEAIVLLWTEFLELNRRVLEA